ncbi:LAMI_0B04786g1_1 [Lachancea mirantina]|uniref:LAMI_0B04786g1_1 n=1 Tax=Lachancea mirantina TaxID=1230905 RepID=A0A1G4IVX7_9SACH|nr:LAMI_0B04786g1_1 [Lachancea mirantina]
MSYANTSRFLRLMNCDFSKTGTTSHTPNMVDGVSGSQRYSLGIPSPPAKVTASKSGKRNPLDVPPLNNSAFVGSNDDTSVDSSSPYVSADERISPDCGLKKRDPAQEEVSPEFQMPKRNLSRRPPPPVVDLNLATLKSGDALFTGTTVKSAEVKFQSMADESHHKRNKSEIEQLLEDLEDYEHERNATLQLGKVSDQPPAAVHTDANGLYTDEVGLTSDVGSLNFAESISDSIQQSPVVATQDNAQMYQFPGKANTEPDKKSIEGQFYENPLGYSPTVGFPSQGENPHSVQKQTPFEFFDNDVEHIRGQTRLTHQDDDDRFFEEQPRQYRVVNEEKPNFYFNDNESFTEDESVSFSEGTPPVDQGQTLNLSPLGAERDTQALTADPSSPVTSSLYMQTPEPVNTASQASSSDHTGGIEKLAVISNSTSPSTAQTDKNVRLVSSYVEELRLKYFPTSNFLQPPPNLPFALKNKNNLEQPQNIKVRIRTSSKQIGIKHGKAKQKLLSLETADEDAEEDSLPPSPHVSTSTKVDHTKEFHQYLGKTRHIPHRTSSASDEDFMCEIPGDEAYNSDDILAPLRERKEDVVKFHGQTAQPVHANTRPSRSDTVTSYFTRKANRLRSGTLDDNYVPNLTATAGSVGNAELSTSISADTAGSSDEVGSLKDLENYSPGRYGDLRVMN